MKQCGLKLLGVVFLITCASHQSTVRNREAIPQGVLDRICQLASEDFPGQHPRFFWYGDTSNIHYFESLLLAYRVSPTSKEQEQAQNATAAAESAFERHPIEARWPPSCSVTVIDRRQANAHWSELFVEISPVVVNPFDPKHETGVFLKFSLGGTQAPSVYWVPTQNPRLAQMLDYSEN